MNRKFILLYFLFILIVFFNCPPSNNSPKDKGEDKLKSQFFSLNDFEQNIINTLDGNVVGYAYAINSNGNPYSWGHGGYSRTPVDGNEPMNYDLPVNVASLSKTITAIAVLKRFEEGYGISIDDSIILYLPPHWTQGPNLINVTIRDLLTHRSGIRDMDGGDSKNDRPLDYEGLKDTIELGIELSNHGDYCYQNTNFALFRIILPYMNGHTYTGNDATDAVQTSDKYVDYVKTNIFYNSGALQVSTALPPNDVAPMLYPFPDNGFNGYSTGDWTLICGGGGWYCSTFNYAKVLKTLLYTQTLIPSTVRQQMLDDSLGCNHVDLGSYGTGYHHNGVLYYQSPSKPEGGMFMSYYIFPNDVEAVVYYNSRPGPKHINNILKDAWMDAWRKPKF